MRDDLNYLNKLNSNNLDSPYVLHVLGENVKGYLYDIKKHESLSLIHLNIRSMDSNFDKIHNLFLNCSNSFNIICVTEAWYTDKETLRIIQISIYQVLILYIKKEKLSKNGVAF